MLVTINRNVHQSGWGSSLVSPSFWVCSGPTATSRSKAKSHRRDKLIAAAERLVAERGFLAVRLEDIGAAVGVSGPAIYRHFPNKEALLVELLVGISTRLLAGAEDGRRRRARRCDRAGRIDRLPPRLRPGRVRSDPHPGPRSGISARAREASGPQGPAAVRGDLGRRPSSAGPRGPTKPTARLMAHAVFGLLNSTPHSVRPGAAKSAGQGTISGSRAILREMTIAALSSAGRSGG